MEEKLWFNKNIEEVKEELNTNIDTGLSGEEARKRIEEYGYNELKEKFAELTDFFNLHPEEIHEITIIGYCRKNEWNGNVSPQIEICDYQISKSTAWYF